MERLEPCGAGESQQRAHYHRQDARWFYVTVVEGQRVGFLLGPYSTHQETVNNVDRGRKLAVAADSWADFYSFGTASLPAGNSRRTVFGH
ncbi:hypothetical protein LCGC14_1541460 [marine sediment metagenome]|uniref:Uncharacterized protein n=1 Tax=marine sediment metagenome TaxID=412755 RepID=A0A0F9LTQ0_9ZZZZ